MRRISKKTILRAASLHICFLHEDTFSRYVSAPSRIRILGHTNSTSASL